jgi:hypothetical protein
LLDRRLRCGLRGRLVAVLGGQPHRLRVVTMIGRDRGADLVLLLAHGVGADVDPGDELDPIEIGETADTARRLRLVASSPPHAERWTRWRPRSPRARRAR